MPPLQALWSIALQMLNCGFYEDYMSIAPCLQQAYSLEHGHRHVHACRVRMRPFGDPGRLTQHEPVLR